MDSDAVGLYCLKTFSCTLPINASANSAVEISTKPNVVSALTALLPLFDFEMFSISSPHVMRITHAYSTVRYVFFKMMVPISITGSIFELLNKTCVGYVKKSHDALERPTVPTEQVAKVT